MIRAGIAIGLISVSGMSACTVTPENAYPEAMSARDCQVLYEADVNARRSAMSTTTSSGNFLADAFASGLGAGIAESQTNARLALCLDRVGATPSEISAVQSTPARTEAPAVETLRYGDALCSPGSGPMVRGTSYCVAR